MKTAAKVLFGMLFGGVTVIAAIETIGITAIRRGFDIEYGKDMAMQKYAEIIQNGMNNIMLG